MEENLSIQPENMQENSVVREGNNPILIVILLIIIIGGGVVLAFLLYRQSQEPPIVLDEVVQTIDLPESIATPESMQYTPVPTSPSE